MLNHSYWLIKCVFKYQDSQILVLKLNGYNHFHPIEVVGRVHKKCDR